MIDLKRLKELTNKITNEIKNSNGFCYDFIKFLLNNVKTFAFIVDHKYQIIFINSSLKEYLMNLNISLDSKYPYWKVFFNANKQPDNDPIKRAYIEQKIIKDKIVFPKTNKHFEVTAIPLFNNGVSSILVLVVPMEDA